MLIHTVEVGDTVYSIAKKYRVSPTKILEDNDLYTPDRLAVGEKIVILFPTKTYTVKAGDTLEEISKRFALPLRTLYQNNPALMGEDAIYQGQLLTLEYPDKPYAALSLNAYAYPHIETGVLKRTLPYLTYLTVFSARTTSNGEILLPDDETLRTEAKKYGVAPILLLTNISENGGYSKSVARDILSNPAARVRMLEELKKALHERKYEGVEFDFEYVPRELAESYANLVEDARTRLGADGFCVFVSCAPKASSAYTDALSEGHAYTSLGQGADGVRLMTYGWGSAYGKPNAIAPMPQLESALEYALSCIPAHKLSLGIASFGYDHPLPYVAGKKANSVCARDAAILAANQGARIEYDPKNQAPYFHYDAPNENTNVRHAVHFEDAESIHAKLALAGELGVLGINLWNMMQYFPQFWLIANALFEIVRPFPCTR